MDSKERVLKTLNFEKTDRLAVFDEYWTEFETNCIEKLALPADTCLTDYFGIDIAIAVPDECPYPGLRRVVRHTEDDTIEVNGWGAVSRAKKGAYFSEELEFLIKEHNDLERYPFEEAETESRYEDFLREVKIEKAKGRCVFGKIGGPYIRSTFIRGQTNFLMDVAGDEGFARELAGRIGDFLLRIGKEQVIRGELFDTGIWICDDMGYNLGPMVSPSAFEKIFYPVYKKLVSGLKKLGVAKVGLHSDGDIRLLLDMLLDTGIDLINPVEPRAGMSIAELRKKYGTKLAYVGGMCNSDVLINGPEGRIRDRTHELIEIAREGGVVIGAHSIGPDIPVQNYLCYMHCIEQSNMNW